MIETIVKNYLDDALDVSVFLEVPLNPPETYIVIEKTGSSTENHIITAMLAIQSVAGSMYEAAELNEYVKEAMENIVELGEIGRCDCNSDYNYTDTRLKNYRYQAVFDIVYYE